MRTLLSTKTCLVDQSLLEEYIGRYMPANRSHCFVTSLIHWINTLVFDACYRTRKSHASEGFEIAWTVVAEASKWLANEKNRRWRYKEKGKRMGSFGATRYIIIQGNSFAEVMGNAVITMNLASEHDWAKPRIHPTPLLFQHRPSCNCYSLIYKARSSGQDFTLNSVKKHLESGAMKKSKLVHEHASPLRSSATNKNGKFYGNGDVHEVPLGLRHLPTGEKPLPDAIKLPYLVQL
ncbi:hypothetical protein HZH68_005264 [Vespula germanica]|uniref:Uncharacterized protein n=1 Tax=Vespula germanica TaxID=30212 RepID=A0A834KFW6_VESGE|nr:hypothetical protein HZH68_005264 [Vespula germanica]